MVREFPCPVNVSPLIRLGRWCMLFAGTGYGYYRHNALQRYEDGRRALREQQNAHRKSAVTELKDAATNTVDQSPDARKKDYRSSDDAQRKEDAGVRHTRPTTSPDVLTDPKHEGQKWKTAKKAIIVVDRTPGGQKDIVVADPSSTTHRKDTSNPNGSTPSAGRKDTAGINPSPIEHPYIWDDPLIVV